MRVVRIRDRDTDLSIYGIPHLPKIQSKKSRYQKHGGKDRGKELQQTSFFHKNVSRQEHVGWRDGGAG